MGLEKGCEQESLLYCMCMPSASKRGATLRRYNPVSKLTGAVYIAQVHRTTLGQPCLYSTHFYSTSRTLEQVTA